MTANTSDADAQIAAAEQRLADALQMLDDARANLARRERELLELMERFGKFSTADDALDVSQDPDEQ